MSKATIVRNPGAEYPLTHESDFNIGQAYEDDTGAIYLCVTPGMAGAHLKDDVLFLQLQDTKEDNGDYDFSLFTVAQLGRLRCYREVNMAITVGAPA